MPNANSFDAVVDAKAAEADVVLLDADPMLRDGLSIIATVKCVGDYAVVTYAPASLEDTNRFHEDFNCGLSLIAENGTYDTIRNSYDGGDRSRPPFCLATSSFDEIDKECRKNENKKKKK